jgi:hypothetical protein
MTAPDQCCTSVRKFLPGRRPHMTQSGHGGQRVPSGKFRRKAADVAVRISQRLRSRAEVRLFIRNRPFGLYIQRYISYDIVYVRGYIS